MSAFVTLGQIEQSLLTDTPRRRFIIPGVLPAGPVLLYGASGTGKTGIAVRTAIAVAAGLAWAGHEVIAGSVLYVAGEDVEGTKERMVGAAGALGLSPSDLPLGVMEAPSEGLAHNAARIAVVGAARQLAKQAGIPIALIVVDTLAACFGSKSQDDATAASDFMNNSDRTARELGCAVLNVHHTGKDENAGMRGSKVFFDRADAVLRVKRGQGPSSFLTVEKLRNGTDGGRYAFDIEGTEVQTAGGPISVQAIRSLRVLERETESQEEGKARQKQTDKTQMLGVLASLAGSGSADNAAWREACFALWPSKAVGTRRKVFSANRKLLLDDGLISINGEAVTIAVTGNPLVTPSVTPQITPVTVTVTDPPSKKGAEGDGRTMRERSSSQGNGTVGGIENGPEKEADERPTGLSRGAGVKDPALTGRRGNGNGDATLEEERDAA